jgi:hypothetical protein
MTLEELKAWLERLQAQVTAFIAQQKNQTPVVLPTAPPPVVIPPQSVPTPVVSAPARIDSVATAHLGRHLTLDPSVPKELGCAEAVSYILRQAGLAIPNGGFQGTAPLYVWLKAHFDEVKTAQPGDIIICVTGQSAKNSPHGHVGEVGVTKIRSNDSNTGLWAENYTLESWKQYFGKTLGFPVHIFRVRA